MTKNILLILLAALILLQLHNAVLYPITKGFDAPNHIDYIRYIKVNNRVPLPHEGWELYQTPLYYAISSIFPAVKSVKYLGFLMWLLLVGSSYLFFKKQSKNIELSLLTVIIASSIPVVIYLTSAIGNEFFSGIMISLTIMYYYSLKETLQTKQKIYLGILLGLSLLSKATAFILLIAIILSEIHRAKKNMFKFFNRCSIFFITAFFISGWFYLRNLILFKTPFISSVDFPKFKDVQPPPPRTFAFLTNLDGFLKMDLFKSHHYSFLSGTYFSWFYDGHNALIPVQPFSKIGILLVLFTFPLFFFSILGYIKEVKKLNPKKAIFIIYPILLLITYVLYNLKIPLYSTVKGVFLVSLAVPFAYFSLKGIQPYYKHKNIIVLFIIMYTLVIIKNFWIMPQWYKQ